MDKESAAIGESRMKNILFYISRYIIGFVFIIAAIPKIADPSVFARSIEAYQFLPTYLINLTALILPWLELLVGLFLIIGFSLKGSAVLSVVLLTSFSILISIALLRGLTIDCGCFGNIESPLTISRLIEDLILLILSVYVVYIAIKKT